jgi:ubiquinone/menaquinone biosynthesis C-methylase UbiE
VRRPEFIARQSRCPSGFLGWFIGQIMSVETAAANDAALTALALEPGDRVLEVGFGHGRTVERAAGMVPEGLVVGIDPSDEMVRMATRRCRRLIEAGRVRLARADSASIPYPDGFFDKAYAVHTIYFWDEPGRHLRELGRVLRDGGRLVLGFHANKEIVAAAFPASVYTFYSTDEVSRLLEQTGFDGVEGEYSAGGVALAIARHRRSA